MRAWGSPKIPVMVRLGHRRSASSWTCGRTIGLNAFQTYTRIVLPQALRNMLPALVGQFIILVQGTSLISAFSVIELTGAGEILFNRYGNPLETYAFIGLVYFAIDFALANVRALLERRLGTTGVAPAD
jgi:ABC-type amino acid transport system permease subunit